MYSHRNIFAICLLVLLTYTCECAEAPGTEKSLQVLQSSSSLKEKSDACRTLAISGGDESVPVLAALLADENLSHMARYALERIQSPQADRALKDSLNSLHGKYLAGVIHSIGVRGDKTSVEPLGKFLTHTNSDVAGAAARALGQIGSDDAARYLLKAWSRNKTGSLGEGLIRCSEKTKGRLQDKIFKALMSPDSSPQLRAGALEGSVLSGRGGQKALYKALTDIDPVMFTAALRVLPRVEGTQITKELMAMSKSLGSDREIMLIQAIAKRGDPACLPGMYGALQSEDTGVRRAAARALGEIGRASSAGQLALAARDSDQEVSKAAFESLASLRGNEADAALRGLLASRNPDERKLGLDVAERRRMTSVLPEIVSMVQNDEKLGPAAARKIGTLGRDSHMSVLIEFLLKARKESDLQAGEAAMINLAARSSDKEKLVAQLANQMHGVGKEQKMALLKVSGGIETPGSLKVLQQASGDAEDQVRMTALGLLETWPGVEAAEYLLQIARDSDGTARAIAMRGYLRLAANSDIAENKRLEMCREAAGLVQSEQEKKQLISAISAIKSPEAIPLIEPWLNDDSVKQEAQEALTKLKAKKPTA